MTKNFRERVESIQDLATFSDVMMQVIAITKDANSTARELASAISRDHSLTAKLLKTVNSAFYGFHREIGTVLDAVVLLGFNQVKQVALATSVLEKFRKHHKLLNGKALWQHSLACAVSSNLFEALYGWIYPEIRGAYVAGLLHDIGKVVIDQYFPDQFEEVLRIRKSRKITYLDAELDVLGATHCEVGAWLAEKWGFPLPLVDSIRYHHSPSIAPRINLLTYVVHVSDVICNNLGLAGMKDQPSMVPDARVAKLLHIGIGRINQVHEELESNMNFFEALTSNVA